MGDEPSSKKDVPAMSAVNQVEKLIKEAVSPANLVRFHRLSPGVTARRN
jgi:hypothetical protein